MEPTLTEPLEVSPLSRTTKTL